MPLSFAERQRRRREEKRAQERWKSAHRAWRSYGKNLKQIGGMVHQIIQANLPDLEEGEVGWQLALQRIMDALDRYATALDPWARAVGQLMLAEVARREERVWIENARRIGREMKREIEGAPIGRAYHESLARQVDLITSLPRDAAQRVHELATGQLYSGLRGQGLVEEILRTSHLTVSHATLIARTEVARASTEITKARAQFVGSPGYIWRTARDADVRASHRRLEGTFHRWDEPPLSDPPDYHAHAGQIWNCFPGDTLVSLRHGVVRVWRAFYEGELVRLDVAGQVVEATPNHPVLTSKGWKAARLLNVGDYLLRMPAQGFGASDLCEDERESTFGELFESLVRDHGSRNCLGGLDFHGDVIDNNVDVVTVNDDLLLHRQARRLQAFRKTMLDERDSRILSPLLSGFEHVLVPDASGASDVSFPLVGRPQSRLGSVVPGETAQVDAVSFEGVCNESRLDVVSLRDPHDASSGSVVGQHQVLVDRGVCRRARGASSSAEAEFLETSAERAGSGADRDGRVLDQPAGLYELCRLEGKDAREFRGHVYTLQSLTGYYAISAAGILVKNCRCYCEVVLPDEFADRPRGVKVPTEAGAPLQPAA